MQLHLMAFENLGFARVSQYFPGTCPGLLWFSRAGRSVHMCDLVKQLYKCLK